jgi:hypothetical protein
MISIITNYNYFPLQVSEDHWIVYKVDDWHYKYPDKIYHIKRWGGEIHCDCPAGHRCKHLSMIQPKKELF